MKNSIFLVRAANSVIPEGAKRLSGIQKKGGYWIPDLGFASSGMTIVYCLLQSKSEEKSSATDN
jgi:hypothetical protein